MNIRFKFVNPEKLDLKVNMQGLRNILSKEMALYHTWFSQKVLTGQRTSAFGVQVRSGNLRRSFRHSTDIYRVGQPIRAYVGWPEYKVGDKTVGTNPLIYAQVHEQGATIKPRNKKFLTIPLEAAMTPAGVTRQPASAYSDAFFIRKGKNLLLVRKSGAKGKGRIVPLFLLVKSVKIPARLAADIRFTAWARTKLPMAFGKLRLVEHNGSIKA